MEEEGKEVESKQLYIQLEGNECPTPMPQEEQKSWRDRICPLFTISFYRPYFDITSKEALRRVWSALAPCRGGFYRELRGRADLYVPFWTYVSVALTLTVVSNGLRYMGDGEDYKEFNFSLLLSASSLV
eukprot:TRINITY_DN10810_c0_g1_i2.p1 TRINITY_DN10810_c0_g1~~TRINITY_DN10810_c0_g1_i2.p1  ORF type:complete len:129 (-),score=22.51 TRINITY_DN10810_c0_g1_i2:358-744(-)